MKGKITAGLAALALAVWGLAAKKDRNPLRILTEQIPNAVCGQPYRVVIQAAGGTKPYTWSATGLPAWLVLTTEGDKAVLSGTPPADCGSGAVTGMLLAQARR